jgi:insulysin
MHPTPRPLPCRHPLDELEALVREKFAGVKDGGIAAPAFPPDAVTSEQGGLLLRMVPERDGHSIEVQWPTVSEHQHYRQAPSHYASHLLGHEGEGSAFALLKARGWATGLVAGEAGTSYRCGWGVNNEWSAACCSPVASPAALKQSAMMAVC